jgi:2-polyprenyl-3-methyl-5-hydroxy-6-metoxy-1,4-benzoquinol methylase
VPAERPLAEAALEHALETVALTGARRPRVLDVGCGDGWLAARIAAAGAEVAGVDPSQVALERARAAHPALELRALGPDGRLPFDDSVFDVAVCVHVLEHVADTQTLLSEIRRLLAPGGLLAVAVPWHGRLANVLTALFSFEHHHDPLEPVLRFYTKRSLHTLLEDFGFAEIEVRGAGGVPPLRHTLLARARRD